MTTQYQLTNIKIKRGDSKPYQFNIEDSSGDAVDLSGLTITCQGREKYDNSAELWDLTLTDGVNGNDFDAGILVLKLPSATTTVLPEEGFFDIEASNEITYVTGYFKLLKDVTR